MRREFRERFPRHRFQRKPLVSDPGMHHCTCVTHVPWCMSGSLARGGWENVPGIPGTWQMIKNTHILGRELGPSRVSPNQRSRWKLAFSPLNMFNLRLCNAATIRFSLLKFGHMHLCGKGYKYCSPHCCKCNRFGCIVAIRCGNACHGPHSDSVYSGSEHHQFNSPRLVRREVGFPNPRRALIGSNQLWRVMTHHTTENIIAYLRIIIQKHIQYVITRSLCYRDCAAIAHCLAEYRCYIDKVILRNK